MKKKTLQEWFKELYEQFDERDLKYLSVQKALIQFQLKDAETGEIHLHNVEYKAKELEELSIKKE
jgi:hypothetical protein